MTAQDGAGAPRAGARWLAAGALASLVLALLHVGMIPAGEPAYVYVTAPERVVALARAGSLVPPVLALVMAGALFGFAVCAFQAARRSERPGLRILLVGVTAIYLLRGSLIVPEGILVAHAGYPARILVFSGIALLVGVVHLVGLARAWPRLGPTSRSSGSFV